MPKHSRCSPCPCSIIIVVEERMDAITFFKYFGLTTLSILLVAGLSFWIKTLLNKFCPDWKLWIKYKLLKRKFNEDAVRFLTEDLENGVESDEMFRSILISGKVNRKQAEELRYIYKKLQRGYKNE